MAVQKVNLDQIGVVVQELAKGNDQFDMAATFRINDDPSSKVRNVIVVSQNDDATKNILIKSTDNLIKHKLAQKFVAELLKLFPNAVTAKGDDFELFLTILSTQNEDNKSAADFANQKHKFMSSSLISLAIEAVPNNKVAAVLALLWQTILLPAFKVLYRIEMRLIVSDNSIAPKEYLHENPAMALIIPEDTYSLISEQPAVFGGRTAKRRPATKRRSVHKKSKSRSRSRSVKQTKRRVSKF